MISTLLLIGTLTVGQGQALEIVLPDEPALAAATAEWEGHSVPFVRAGGRWVAVIGVDLEASPGPHGAEIRMEYGDGRTRTQTQEVVVSAEDFPTTKLEVEPRYVELDPADQARSAREAREIAAIHATVTPARLWDQAFQSPIPGASGGRNFGHRRVFNGQPRAPHSGADLSASLGTPIRASNRGRVVLAKDLFFSGNAVFLDHGLGVYSSYLHLSEIRVAEGEIVERGAVVGLAGATGRVTGPHLHWGARVLDARVDPFSLLSLDAH